jgi:hypothetical protein
VPLLQQDARRRLQAGHDFSFFIFDFLNAFSF